GEIVTSVRVPAVKGAAYVKHKHPASGYAVVGVAAVVAVEGGTCRKARVVIGGVTGTPVLTEAVGAGLEGASPSAEAIAVAASKADTALSGAIGDTDASADYRLHLAPVLTRRAPRAALPP